MPGVLVQAPEPRFVAPTRRDSIGRIWAPVMIHGRGPFRLVLDTVASGSAITAQVAAALGLTPDISHPVLVRGVTGNGEVRIFEHWHLTREPARLIGMDALGLLDALVIDYRLRELQLLPH